MKRTPLKDDEEERFVTIAPDGGWGWVVVVAAFLSFTITDGLEFSFGIFLKDLSVTFKCTESTISLASAINLFTFCSISCPISAALINKHGYRKISVLGSILSCIGFLIVSICNNLYIMLACYGFLCGMGYGMIFMSSLIAVGFYFEKWRAVANGISACGSGVGGIAFPPIFTLLLNEIGWRRTFRWLACVALVSIFWGLAFRPIKQTRIIVPKAKVPKHTSYFEKTYNRLATIVPSLYNMMGSTSEPVSEPELIRTVSSCGKCCKKSTTPHRPMYKDDIFYNSAVKQLPQYKNAKKDDLKQTKFAYELSVTRIIAEDEEEELNKACKCCPIAVKTGLATMLDYKLFKLPIFHLLLANSITMALGLYGPYLYIKDSAIKHGIDGHTAYWLVSTIGFANMIGRLICGALSCIPKLKAIIICYILLTIGGVATIFEPYDYELKYQFLFCAIYGFCSASMPCLRTIVAVEMLGLKKLSSGVGMMLCFQGMGTLVGTILSAYLNDSTNDFKLTFYFGGVGMVLSGIFLLIAHVIVCVCPEKFGVKTALR